jgi:hypothetical protein
MAVLLRVNGIPARLVGGYRGGYYNEMGNYYLVPQKNAHVWVEAYERGRGWVRFDPTPAAEGLSSASAGGIFMRLQMFLDTINYYWYGIVLTYNLERQIWITKTIVSGFRKPSLAFPPFMKKTLQYSSLVAAAAGLMVLTWFLITLAKRKEMAMLDRFLRKLKAAGYEKQRSEGLEEFLRRIGDDDLRAASLEFVREFERIYYSDRRFTPDDFKRLGRLASEIDGTEKRAGKRTGTRTVHR